MHANMYVCALTHTHARTHTHAHTHTMYFISLFCTQIQALHISSILTAVIRPPLGHGLLLTQSTAPLSMWLCALLSMCYKRLHVEMCHIVGGF